MSELRKVQSIFVAGIEVRSCIIRREKNQRVEETNHSHLIAGRQMVECIARRLRFAAVTQDHLHEIDAATVMTVRRSGADAPQRRRHKLRPQRSVVVPLMKVWAEIMALEIGEDVLDEKGAELRRLQSGKSAVVIRLIKERGGGGEEIVEDAVGRIVNSLDICDAAVAVDLQIGDVTLRASNLAEYLQAILGRVRLLVGRRLEIVQEIELLMVNEAVR